MTGLYSLRHADRSVRIAVVLFLALLGAGYAFAFLMVRAYAGLTPRSVAATYAPVSAVDPQLLPNEPSSNTETLDLGSMSNEAHKVDTNLLIQDSHVHLVLYALVAAALTLIILGLDWGSRLRDTMIVLAFAAGALDFAGQWLMNGGIASFAMLTIAAGWMMAAVYVVVVAGTVSALVASATTASARRRS